MSVVIRGIDKPDSCRECMFLRRDLIHYGNCFLMENEYKEYFYDEQYEHCPLIWIPDSIDEGENGADS